MSRGNAQKPRDRPVIKRVPGGSSHLTIRRDFALRDRENSLSKCRIPKLIRACAHFNNAANQFSRECGRCFWGHDNQPVSRISMYTAVSDSRVNRLSAWHIWIILRSLAAVVHPVVPDYPNPPEAHSL